MVILDKISYISAIEEILNDNTKFSNLDIPGKEINYITNLEKRITFDLKLWKDEETIVKRNFCGKVLKETKNGLPPFCPILSTIGTPTNKLAKLLLPFLMPLTQN